MSERDWTTAEPRRWSIKGELIKIPENEVLQGGRIIIQDGDYEVCLASDVTAALTALRAQYEAELARLRAQIAAAPEGVFRMEAQWVENPRSPTDHKQECYIMLDKLTGIRQGQRVRILPDPEERT